MLRLSTPGEEDIVVIDPPALSRKHQLAKKVKCKSLKITFLFSYNCVNLHLQIDVSKYFGGIPQTEKDFIVVARALWRAFVRIPLSAGYTLIELTFSRLVGLLTAYKGLCGSVPSFGRTTFRHYHKIHQGKATPSGHTDNDTYAHW